MTDEQGSGMLQNTLEYAIKIMPSCTISVKTYVKKIIKKFNFFKKRLNYLLKLVF